MPTKPKKKRPGPAPKAPEDRAQIVSTSVPPDLKAWLSQYGCGRLTANLRQAAIEMREKYEKKEIEKS